MLEVRVIRFSGFEIDRQRAVLRGLDGARIKVRAKTFEVLFLLVSNAGRVVTKQELMDAVWPGIHVSDDSLFQCIKELRTVLGDVDRVLIKAVAGRGYRLDAEVSDAAADIAPISGDISTPARRPPDPNRLPVPQRWAIAFSAFAGMCIILALGAVAATLLSPARPPTIAVMPITDASGDPTGQAMAIAVTENLADGLAGIETIHLIALSAGSQSASFRIVSELDRDDASWTLKARLIETATDKVHGVASVSVDGMGIDRKLVQSRLVGGIGDQLARSLNVLLETGPPAELPASAGSKVAIQQAAASINQTSPERFAVAETMLKEALRAERHNVDLQVALANMQLRGIQLAWYDPDERLAAQDNARALLEEALEARPRSIAALEAQCRLLSAATQFAESLVACGKVLSFDPWNGSALYLIGLGQLYLGRMEDALATFTLADSYDTPSVSRWTWLLGAGWANLLLDRNAEAIPWLERSIAITPGSGRSHTLLAVAYERLGQRQEAMEALAQVLRLRPGSTIANLRASGVNMSPVFMSASEDSVQVLARLGLPQE